MKELKGCQGSAFGVLSRIQLIENRDTILEFTAEIQELQNENNCMNDTRDFQDAESVRSGQPLIQILVDCEPFRTEKLGCQTLRTHVEQRETFLRIQPRLLQHLIRKSRIHGVLKNNQNKFTHHRR